MQKQEAFKYYIDKLPQNWEVSCWYIEQLDCVIEENLIIEQLKKLDKVKFIKSNLFKKQIYVAHDKNNKNDIILAISALGLTIKEFSDDVYVVKDKNYFNNKKTYLLFISGILAFISELLHYYKFSLKIIFFMSLISILFSGVKVFYQGVKSLFNGNLNINVLMTIAVFGAVLIGEFSESAMVIFLYSLSELLESYSLFRAKKNIEKIIIAIPNKILIKDNNNDLVEILVKKAKIGQIAIAKPGDKIILDGIIIKGQSYVNQVSITGESTPVEKNAGDMVYAGSINESGLLEYEIKAEFNNTQLSQIINLVESAQENKASINNFIDKFTSVYIPVILTLSFFIMFIVPLVNGQWLQWIYNGLVLLVISCPCALLISTPIAIVSALTVALNKGIIIKGGKFIELLHNAKWIGLDKTGTITYGAPYITNFICVKYDANLIRLLALSLAKYSNHPLSRAIINKDMVKNLFLVTDFNSITGLGITGKIQNKVYFLGNIKYINLNNINCHQKILDQINIVKNKPVSNVIFCDDKEVLALFTLEDKIRPNIKSTINSIRKQGINVFLVSGDHKQVSQYVAEQVGIQEIYFEQLPTDKLSVINKKLELNNGKVIMVGDGINDSLALVRADIGICMGKLGTDLTIEASDIILINDDLTLINYLLKLSKKTFLILKENISFILFIKVLFIILTLFSLSNMLLAIFADVGATLLVIINSMRLLNFNKYNYD